VLDKDGTVWSWGLSVFGQCGHNSLHDEKLPRRIETFSNPADPSEKILIKSIACGSHHSLALDTYVNLVGCFLLPQVWCLIAELCFSCLTYI
jgi:alpha-tubulin suppressor-like RCC1 family protein